MSQIPRYMGLGHVGLRHNIYFSSNPPNHLRIYMDGQQDEGTIMCIYYGIPNLVVGYVNGKRVEPFDTPTWDSLKLPRLLPSFSHGTYVWDRVGVETGRPGYLYVVVRGGKKIDFKITHKVVLTTKVKVDSEFGGWDKNKNPDGSVNPKKEQHFST